MRNRRLRRREDLVRYLGGECLRCGSKDDLEIDHRNREDKLFTLSGKGLDTKWSRILEEADKCDLLCSEHHLEKSKECKDLGQVDHGGGVSGKKNCKCVPCRERKAEYMKNYIRPDRAGE